jgi:hypothetical protein
MSHFVVVDAADVCAHVGMLQTLLAALHLALLPAMTPPGPQAAGGPTEAGATSVRWASPAGPVRIWKPAGYAPETAATVIYVHGYHRHADSVWTVADLARQFADSGRNALFVVPTAAESDRSPMRWARLADLFADLAARGIERPAGPVVVVGHSGAYRTVSRWVGQDDAGVSAVILLDALYGGHAAFERFARRGRLAVVTHSTAPQAARFLARMPGVVRRSEVPSGGAFTAAEREARVLALDTQLGHASLNDTGAFLPALLGLFAPPTWAPETANEPLVTAAR